MRSDLETYTDLTEETTQEMFTSGGGIAPTIRTFQGGNQQPLIVEQKVCVAMRGRPTDGSDYSGETEQKLEPNLTGNVNTLTGVQKDNLILEAERHAISTNGTETSGTIRASYYKNGERNIIENIKSHKGYEGVIITEKAENPDAGEVHEIREADIETDPYTLAYEDGEYFYFIRIRKLTPRECWRLMSFEDADFNKAQEVNSNTQLYKQAGNSIVKNVLVALIGRMFAGYEDKYKEGNNDVGVQF